MLSLKHINKTYQKGTKTENAVLKNITVTFPDTGLIAIHGKSGSGKTTLLNIIGGMLPKDDGELELDGTCLLPETDEYRSRTSGFIYQNYCLNENKTVYDNIADVLRILGERDEETLKKRVSDVLSAVGMEHYEKRMPNSLSGGQKQRIAIARALAKSPDIILADEPTGNLDEANTDRIMELLREISTSCLVLLVTHEENLISEYCDAVYELEDGSCVTGVIGAYTAKEKGQKETIYLGELNAKCENTVFGTVTSYGTSDSQNLSIRLVFSEGHIYLYDPEQKLEVITDSSEIQIEEGTRNPKEPYREKACGELKLNRFEAPQGKPAGRLYTIRQSLQAGMRKMRSGSGLSNALKFGLFLGMFLAILIFAEYGNGIKEFMTAGNLNSSKMFYGVVRESEKIEELKTFAEQGLYGIERVSFERRSEGRDATFAFLMNAYNSERIGEWDSIAIVPVHGIMMNSELAAERKIVAGSIDSVQGTDAVISTAVCDQLIDSETYSCLTSYSDLIGLTIEGSTNYRIVGIVENEESVFYVNWEDYCYRNLMEAQDGVAILADSTDRVSDGSVILRYNSANYMDEIPAVGDEIKLNGVPLTISGTEPFGCTYEEWIGRKQSLSEEEPDFETMAVTDLVSYFSEFDSYLRECSENPDQMGWNSVMQQAFNGNDKVKYALMADICGNSAIYYAEMFRSDNGRYPNDEETAILSYEYDDPYEVLEKLSDSVTEESDNDYIYTVSESDYQTILNGFGENIGPGLLSDKPEYLYALIYSENVEETERFVTEYFQGETDENGFSFSTPNLLCKEERAVIRKMYAASYILCGLFLVAFLILVISAVKANVLSNIREIGIGRCLGVRKSNLRLKNAAESAAIVLQTAGIGYLLAMAVVLVLKKSDFFYNYRTEVFCPLWFGILLPLLTLLLTVLVSLAETNRIVKKDPDTILKSFH